MAWTQADVDALKAAVASGGKRVRFGDREVEYQSLGDALTALAAMQAEVDAAAGLERPRQRLAYHAGKGL